MKARKRFKTTALTIIATIVFSMSSCTATLEPPLEAAAADTTELGCMAEQEIIDRRFVELPESPYKEEAEYAARVIYGTARSHSQENQKLVVWCIINRAEHQNYPDTIAGVCQQSQQWMGYSDENPVVEDFYETALAEITTWHDGGHRLVPPEYVFLTWSSDDIVLKTTFEDNDRTDYWRNSK